MKENATVRYIMLGCLTALLLGCEQTGDVSSHSEQAAELAAQNAQASQADGTGEAYLYINAQKPGVQQTASGLQFEILKQGEGRSPGPTSRVLTHYHGTFPDGRVFDSSVDRNQPAIFPLNRVIRGWSEALQMMKEGGKWRLALPPDIAYGEKGVGDVVPPNAVLIFEIELLEVLD